MIIINHYKRINLTEIKFKIYKYFVYFSANQFKFKLIFAILLDNFNLIMTKPYFKHYFTN